MDLQSDGRRKVAVKKIQHEAEQYRYVIEQLAEVVEAADLPNKYKPLLSLLHPLVPVAKLAEYFQAQGTADRSADAWPGKQESGAQTSVSTKLQRDEEESISPASPLETPILPSMPRTTTDRGDDWNSREMSLSLQIPVQGREGPLINQWAAQFNSTANESSASHFRPKVCQVMEGLSQALQALPALCTEFAEKLDDHVLLCAVLYNWEKVKSAFMLDVQWAVLELWDSLFLTQLNPVERLTWLRHLRKAAKVRKRLLQFSWLA